MNSEATLSTELVKASFADINQPNLLSRKALRLLERLPRPQNLPLD